ncbi:MAG: hypothetical protein U0165_20400 [Polyangiaceae bacterium]
MQAPLRSLLRPSSLTSCVIVAATLALSSSTLGCAGHEGRTVKMRSALDAGDPHRAIREINKQLDVESDEQLPKKIEGDDALLVLDRATIQLAVTSFANSKRDFEAADKAIEMVDLSHSAGDEIAKFVFSDSAGRYSAPPHEKLLINTLNMVNYLELGDLSGARVEARRLGVMQSYYRDTIKRDNPILGFSGFLAGFVFEKSGDPNEALRWYDEALKFSAASSLKRSVAALAPLGTYKSPRIDALAAVSEEAPPDPNEGEIVVVMGYGRVPHKIAQRVPIGLALTYTAGALSPTDAAAANRLAAQGLVTWVNYPELAPEQGAYELPSLAVDGRRTSLEQAVDISAEVRTAWQEIQGKVVASAITRMISRVAVGAGIQAASGRDSITGLLLSLGTQAAMTAADTPDTRSWETLPARVAVSRVRVPAGRHRVLVSGRGVSRDQPVDVAPGGWVLVSLLALR